MIIKWILRWLGQRRGYRNSGDEQILSTLPSPQDNRDFISSLEKTELPEKFLIDHHEIKQQGKIGSCYAFAICSAFEMINKNKYGRVLNLSELYLWHKTHVGDLPTNGGYIRDALKFAQKTGIALELFWPYDISKWNDNPDFKAEFSAGYFKIKSYYRINGISELKSSVFKGFPVVFGMKVYADSLKTNLGVIQAPDGGYRGGHAMEIIGWNKTGFVINNSWGGRWGRLGIATLPFDLYNEHVFESWRFEVY